MANPLKTQRLDDYSKEWDRQKVVDEFSRLYYDDPHTWADTSWMGVLTQKYPTDLIMYAEILFKTKPRRIIECGTALGGSGLFLAHICDILGVGYILSIDSHDPKDHGIVKPKHFRVDYLEGYDSTSTQTLDIVSSFCGPNSGDDHFRTMVILDSDHTKRHVLAELELYHKFVTPGCYLIVEDTNLNSNQARPDHGPGPKEALEEWLPKHPEFEVDERCTRFILTAHPGGYLIRK
jgi:cephalosporin hydroxylase